MSDRILSLQSQLEEATDLRQRVDLLNTLAAELSFSDPAQAIEFAQQACQLAGGEQETPLYPAGLASGLFHLARAHNQRGEYVESLSCLVQAQPYYESLNDENGLMWLFNELGRLHYFLSDYPNALSFYYRTLELAEKLGNTNRQAASFHNIGLIHSSLGNHEQALEILHQGLEIATNSGDKWVEGFLLGSLAEVSYHLQRFDQALKYGLRSLELARINGTPTLIDGTLLAISWTYFELGQFDQAKACLQEVIQTAAQSGDRRGLSEALRALGEQANRRHLPNEALPSLEQALTLAISLGEKALQANCHRALAKSYSQLGQYQPAFEHYQAYHELDKEIFNEKSDLRLKILEVKYQLKTARQEAEIYRLRNEMLEREVADQHRIQQALQHLADHDGLTGLLNRRAFFDRGEKILQSKRKTQFPLALLMLDLDHFKSVNDRYGHDMGDKLLQAIGMWLSSNLREVDLLCRYGGEEFAILMTGSAAAEAEKVAWRLCQTLEAQVFRIGDISLRITTSIGVSVTEQKVDSIDTLIHFADVALYQAKQAGRNCVRTYRIKKPLE